LYAILVVVFVSAFVMVSTVWSVSCLLFYSRCPPSPAICKSGGTCPHALWSRRQCIMLMQHMVHMQWRLLHGARGAP